VRPPGFGARAMAIGSGVATGITTPPFDGGSAPFGGAGAGGAPAAAVRS